MGRNKKIKILKGKNNNNIQYKKESD